MWTLFDDLVHFHGIERVKTIGDLYIAAANILVPVKAPHTIAMKFARDLIKVGACEREGERRKKGGESV